MSIYTLIPIVFIALYLGYWFYIKNKNSQQAQIVSNTDFKAEFANAEKYKNHFLTSELPFLKKAMEQEKIDAFNYASNEYGVASALKDGVKDKLKGIYVKYDKVKWTKYLLVIPFAYFFMMFANALVSILTLYMPENMVGTYDNTKEILNNSSYFMLIITTAIIAPISEEFMHRGVVYNRFKRICPPVLAAIISSIIFGIIHMNFVQGPYAFLVGLAAVYVYERYKSIIAPIILHVTANSVSTIVSIIANETGLDTSAASQYNTVQLTASYLQMAIVFGILALIIGIIIYKTVIPNEIKEIK